MGKTGRKKYKPEFVQLDFLPRDEKGVERCTRAYQAGRMAAIRGAKRILCSPESEAELAAWTKGYDDANDERKKP